MEYILFFVIIYFGIDFLVAIAGTDKKIGYWGTFFISVIFSPVVGLIVASLSKEIDKIEELRNQVFIFRQKKNYAAAITTLQKALSVSPTNPKLLYDLACYYTLNKNFSEALIALTRAVELGYSNFAKINSDSDLTNLREFTGFEKLKNNNFKIIQQPVESNLDKLKKLGELKELGIITEDEFNQQKKKLLEL